MKRHTTRSPEETIALGRMFARSLRPGDVVAVIGELGTGKTHFVAGVCDALGARGHIGSPTFTLINEYPAPFGKVIHIDLYRINTAAEVAELGIEEYFNTRCICLIEWAERVRWLLPPGYRSVLIDYGEGDLERVVGLDGGNEG